MSFGARCASLKPADVLNCLGFNEADLVGQFSGELYHYLLPNGNAHSTPALDLQTATLQFPFSFSIHSLTVHSGHKANVELFVADASGAEEVRALKLPGACLLSPGQRVGVRVRQLHQQQDVFVTLTLMPILPIMPCI
jgi:hypothetical protein